MRDSEQALDFKCACPGGGSQWGGGFYGYRLKFWLLLRLSVNFFQLRLSKKLKINFFCFKELNITKDVFFLTLKQNKGVRII